MLTSSCVQVIREPRPRSARWFSTSIPEAQWQGELARTSSAEYNVNNLVSPVLFQEALWHIPEHAVVLEIAPHALLRVRNLSAQSRPRGPASHWPGWGQHGGSQSLAPRYSAPGCPEAGCEAELYHHPADEERP